LILNFKLLLCYWNKKYQDKEIFKNIEQQSVSSQIQQLFSSILL
jgi:hypothetical protein